jgi:hypothetical protein
MQNGYNKHPLVEFANVIRKDENGKRTVFAHNVPKSWADALAKEHEVQAREAGQKHSFEIEEISENAKTTPSNSI